MENEVKKTAKKKTSTKKKTAAKKQVTARKQAGDGSGKETAAAKPAVRSRKLAGAHKTPQLNKQFESQAHEQLRDWIAVSA